MNAYLVCIRNGIAVQIQDAGSIKMINAIGRRNKRITIHKTIRAEVVADVIILSTKRYNRNPWLKIYRSIIYLSRIISTKSRFALGARYLGIDPSRSVAIIHSVVGGVVYHPSFG